MSEYEIRQVTSYVLSRKVRENSDIFLDDIGTFPQDQGDLAGSVLASLRAMPPEDAAKDAEFRSAVHNAPALLEVKDDGSVSLWGDKGREIFSLATGDMLKNIGGKLALIHSGDATA